MLKNLEEGELPAAGPLRQRLAAALIKKAGILQQPRPCWSSDPKINPEARHLLWAAVILEDGEAIGLAAGLLALELQAGRPGVSTTGLAGLVRQELAALVEPAAGAKLQAELRARIDRAASFLASF